MDIKALLPLVVQGSLVLLVLAIGLQSRWADLLYVIERPRLLLKGFVAVNIVVPAAAAALCLMLPLAPAIVAGIVIMAVSPLAPFAPGKMLKTGADRSYVIGLYVALILLSVLIVPATMAILAAIGPKQVSLPIAAIASFVATSVLLPLVIGIAAGTLWPAISQRAAHVTTIVAYLLLLPLVVLVLLKAGGQIFGLIGDGALAAIVLTVVAGLAAGHVLGGPQPEHRMALAQAAATRHPGIAGLIVHRNFDNPQIMMAVLLFLLTSIVVSTIYTAWANKRLHAAPSKRPASILQS